MRQGSAGQGEGGSELFGSDDVQAVSSEDVCGPGLWRDSSSEGGEAGDEHALPLKQRGTERPVTEADFPGVGCQFLEEPRAADVVMRLCAVGGVADRFGARAYWGLRADERARLRMQDCVLEDTCTPLPPPRPRAPAPPRPRAPAPSRCAAPADLRAGLRYLAALLCDSARASLERCTLRRNGVGVGVGDCADVALEACGFAEQRLANLAALAPPEQVSVYAIEGGRTGWGTVSSPEYGIGDAEAYRPDTATVPWHETSMALSSPCLRCPPPASRHAAALLPPTREPAPRPGPREVPRAPPTAARAGGRLTGCTGDGRARLWWSPLRPGTLRGAHALSAPGCSCPRVVCRFGCAPECSDLAHPERRRHKPPPPGQAGAADAGAGAEAGDGRPAERTCAVLLAENAFELSADKGGEDAEPGGRLDPGTRYMRDLGFPVPPPPSY